MTHLVSAELCHSSYSAASFGALGCVIEDSKSFLNFSLVIPVIDRMPTILPFQLAESKFAHRRRRNPSYSKNSKFLFRKIKDERHFCKKLTSLHARDSLSSDKEFISCRYNIHFLSVMKLISSFKKPV